MATLKPIVFGLEAKKVETNITSLSFGLAQHKFLQEFFSNLSSSYSDFFL